MSIYNIDGIDVQPTNPLVDDALLYKMHSDSTSPRADLQGITTDGVYVYLIEYNRSTIYKYEILTGNITSKTYANNVAGHGNGATYNPNTDKIYIATCNQDGGHGIAVFTTDLDYVESIDVVNESGVAQKVAGIAYDRVRNVYICCWENDYYVYDDNFQLVSTFIVQHSHPYVYGALETDGRYVYRPLWDGNSTPHKNYIAVYNFTGAMVKLITINSTYEAEDIAYDWNGNWYFGFNVDSGIGWHLYYIGLNKYPELSAVFKLGQIMKLS